MTKVVTNEKYILENEFLLFDRNYAKEDTIHLEFEAKVQIKEDVNQEKYFTYGALFYAKSIESIEQKGKTYAKNFDDLFYIPKEKNSYQFIIENQASFQNGHIEIKAKNKATDQIETIELIPFGKTILRQVSF